MSSAWGLTALALLAFPVRAQPPVLKLSLDDAEQAAFAHSPILKAAQSSLASAEDLVQAQFAALLPRLTGDGSYQRQTEVPKFSFSPAAPPQQFGDYKSYAIGPTISWTLWDQGALWSSWKSQKALAQSQDAQRELVRRQVRLMTRLDYFQVQLALEQQRSLIDSLRLADAQYRDIDNRFRAGAASRIDWLSAHQQVLDRRRSLRSAQADLASALRTLFAQTGQGQEQDVSAALDRRVDTPLPEGTHPPTIRVELEPLESVESSLRGAESQSLDAAYPQLVVYRRQAEAQRLSAQSVAAGEWPKIQFSYKGDYQYPNLPLLQSTWQNTALFTASVPLFEYGRTRNQARAQQSLADASERQADEALDELERDWRKARDEVAALRDQEAIDGESTSETAEIARLRYRSYRDGASTILDVQTANIDALQARIAAAVTRTQMLIQLATLDSLSAHK